VTRGQHRGEPRNFFFATAAFAGLFKLSASAHDFERAFAIDFFLKPTQRTIHGFAFFQFNFSQCTHFLSGRGKKLREAIPAKKIRNGEDKFFAREVNELTRETKIASAKLFLHAHLKYFQNKDERRKNFG
jgi:hypothetical protein